MFRTRFKSELRNSTISPLSRKLDGDGFARPMDDHSIFNLAADLPAKNTFAWTFFNLSDVLRLKSHAGGELED